MKIVVKIPRHLKPILNVVEFQIGRSYCEIEKYFQYIYANYFLNENVVYPGQAGYMYIYEAESASYI